MPILSTKYRETKSGAVSETPCPDLSHTPSLSWAAILTSSLAGEESFDDPPCSLDSNDLALDRCVLTSGVRARRLRSSAINIVGACSCQDDTCVGGWPHMR